MPPEKNAPAKAPRGQAADLYYGEKDFELEESIRRNGLPPLVKVYEDLKAISEAVGFLPAIGKKTSPPGMHFDGERLLRCAGLHRTLKSG